MTTADELAAELAAMEADIRDRGATALAELDARYEADEEERRKARAEHASAREALRQEFGADLAEKVRQSGVRAQYEQQIGRFAAQTTEADELINRAEEAITAALAAVGDAVLAERARHIEGAAVHKTYVTLRQFDHDTPEPPANPASRMHRAGTDSPLGLVIAATALGDDRFVEERQGIQSALSNQPHVESVLNAARAMIPRAPRHR